MLYVCFRSVFSFSFCFCFVFCLHLKFMKRLQSVGLLFICCCFFFFAFAEAGVNTLHCRYVPRIGPVHPILALVLWEFPSRMLGICV